MQLTDYAEDGRVGSQRKKRSQLDVCSQVETSAAFGDAVISDLEGWSGSAPVFRQFLVSRLQPASCSSFFPNSPHFPFLFFFFASIFLLLFSISFLFAGFFFLFFSFYFLFFLSLLFFLLFLPLPFHPLPYLLPLFFSLEFQPHALRICQLLTSLVSGWRPVFWGPQGQRATGGKVKFEEDEY